MIIQSPFSRLDWFSRRSERIPVLVAACLAGAASSRAQGSELRRTYHPPAVNRDIEKQGFMNVGDADDWRGWLAANYPDASKTWPADCAAAFDAKAKDESWDFVAKGDFNELGAPTALAIKFLKVAGTEKKMVGRLSVFECRAGAWTELLGVDGARGMAANGKSLRTLYVKGTTGYDVLFATGVKAAPGLQISTTPLDASGNGLAESAQFIYLPKRKTYRVLAH